MQIRKTTLYLSRTMHIILSKNWGKRSFQLGVPVVFIHYFQPLDSMVAFSLTREPLFLKPSLFPFSGKLYPFLPYPGLVIRNRRLYGLVYGRWKSEGPADWVHLAFSFYCRQLNVIFFISLFVPFPLYTLLSFFTVFLFFRVCSADFQLKYWYLLEFQACTIRDRLNCISSH